MEVSYGCDAGVAGRNDDAGRDLFTADHGIRPIAMMSRGGGGFRPLAFDVALPDLRFTDGDPHGRSLPSFVDFDLIVRSGGVFVTASASPRLVEPATLVLERIGGAAIAEREGALDLGYLRLTAVRGGAEAVRTAAGPGGARYAISLPPGASAVFDASLPGRPLRIVSTDGVDPARVWTPALLGPTEGEARPFFLKADLHGLASGDWDEAGARDFFAFRAGQKGSAAAAGTGNVLTDWPLRLRAEAPGASTPVAEATGLENRRCPGRPAPVPDAHGHRPAAPPLPPAPPPGLVPHPTSPPTQAPPYQRAPIHRAPSWP